MSYYLPVYVPLESAPEVGHIYPGSAVVGLPQDDGYVDVHYEGNRYDSVSMNRLS